MNKLQAIKNDQLVLLDSDQYMQALKRALYKLGYEGRFSKALENFRNVNNLPQTPYVDKATLLAVEQQYGSVVAYDQYFADVDGKLRLVEYRNDMYFAPFGKKPLNVSNKRHAGNFASRLLCIANANLGKVYKDDQYMLNRLMRDIGIYQSLKIDALNHLQTCIEFGDFHFVRGLSKLMLEANSALIKNARLDFYLPAKGDIMYVLQDKRLAPCIVAEIFDSRLVCFSLNHAHMLSISTHSIYDDSVVGFGKVFA